MNDLQGKTVAVIDDDPSQRELVCRLLDERGLNTSSFASVEEALAARQEESLTNLIIADRRTPGIDGWRLCHLLSAKESTAGNQAPILVCSASFSGAEAHHVTREVGANAFLPKPFEPGALIEQVRALLRIGELLESRTVARCERSREVCELPVESTELQGTREALRENERRARALFEQAAVGLAEVAPDGRWLRVNQRLCDIVGYSTAELTALTFQDITHPEDLDADLDQVRRMLAGEIETYKMEKRYVRKDGSLVWVNLTVGLVRDESGQPKYLISVIEDIDRRKQAEAELARHARELEAFNKAMVDREMRIIELKKKVNALSAELGREPTYPPIWEQEAGNA